MKAKSPSGTSSTASTDVGAPPQHTAQAAGRKLYERLRCHGKDKQHPDRSGRRQQAHPPAPAAEVIAPAQSREADDRQQQEQALRIGNGEIEAERPDEQQGREQEIGPPVAAKQWPGVKRRRAGQERRHHHADDRWRDRNDPPDPGQQQRIERKECPIGDPCRPAKIQRLGIGLIAVQRHIAIPIAIPHAHRIDEARRRAQGIDREIGEISQNRPKQQQHNRHGHDQAVASKGRGGGRRRHRQIPEIRIASVGDPGHRDKFRRQEFVTPMATKVAADLFLSSPTEEDIAHEWHNLSRRPGRYRSGDPVVSRLALSQDNKSTKIIGRNDNDDAVND